MIKKIYYSLLNFLKINSLNPILLKISRDSIDCLKEFFKDQVTQEEWLFIRDHLKKVFKIF